MRGVTNFYKDARLFDSHRDALLGFAAWQRRSPRNRDELDMIVVRAMSIRADPDNDHCRVKITDRKTGKIWWLK